MHDATIKIGRVTAWFLREREREREREKERERQTDRQTDRRNGRQWTIVLWIKYGNQLGNGQSMRPTDKVNECSDVTQNGC
jgi:hypothetical protein